MKGAYLSIPHVVVAFLYEKWFHETSMYRHATSMYRHATCVFIHARKSSRNFAVLERFFRKWIRKPSKKYKMGPATHLLAGQHGFPCAAAFLVSCNTFIGHSAYGL